MASSMVFLLFAFVLFYGNATRNDEYFLKALFLSVETFFLLSGLLVPYVLSYALPLGLMAGILLSFGRLSAGKEILAMQASGLSLSRIASPVFLLALLATGLCLCVNLLWAPQARAAFEERKQRLFFDNIGAFLGAEKQLEFKAAKAGDTDGLGAGASRYVLSVGKGEAGVWQDVRVWFVGEKGETLGVLFAESGQVRFEESTNQLWLNLRNADYQWLQGGTSNHRVGDGGFVAFRAHEPIALQLRQNTNTSSLKHKTLGELIDLRNQLKDRGEETLQVDLRIQTGCSMAFAPLSLAFLAIPLAIRVGRRETMFNAGLALCLALVYFFFLVILPEWMENSPKARSDLLVWAPNVLFQGIGFLMLRSMER